MIYEMEWDDKAQAMIGHRVRKIESAENCIHLITRALFTLY